MRTLHERFQCLLFLALLSSLVGKSYEVHTNTQGLLSREQQQSQIAAEPCKYGKFIKRAHMTDDKSSLYINTETGGEYVTRYKIFTGGKEKTLFVGVKYRVLIVIAERIEKERFTVCTL